MALASSTSTPPVGKSGPGMWRSRSAVVALGSAIRARAASHTSPALCGGMEVAMPTAMPAAPLASRLGKPPGSTTGSLFLAVVVGAEIDRVVIDAVQHGAGDRGHARFGVSHGRRVIAVDVAEIALAFDQRVAGGEILCQADQRLVHRGLAVGMVFADHVADHAGAFLEPGRRVEPELVHGVEQAAVDGLEAVAHVWQGAGHDGGKGVGEIALAERVGERCVLDGSGFVHAGLLARIGGCTQDVPSCGGGSMESLGLWAGGLLTRSGATLDQPAAVGRRGCQGQALARRCGFTASCSPSPWA